MLTDLKHLLSVNPLFQPTSPPAGLRPTGTGNPAHCRAEWQSFTGGLR